MDENFLVPLFQETSLWTNIQPSSLHINSIPVFASNGWNMLKHVKTMSTERSRPISIK